MSEQKYSPTDKTILKPAEENPWYVLATIYGEEPDDETQNKNQKAWNSWVISTLNDKDKLAIDISSRVSLEEIPKWESEDGIKEEITKLFKQRLPCEELPNTDTWIDFEAINFPKKVDFRDFIFPIRASFKGSEFSEDVTFNGALFCHMVHMGYVTFVGKAEFIAVTFQEITLFKEADFFGDAMFGLTIFKERSNFRETRFYSQGNFYECTFSKPSNFFCAKFFKQFPELVNAVFQEKINISTGQEYWPDPKKCEQSPEEARASCEVLRHAMNNQGLPEQAHFFFRREMQFAGRIGSLWQRLPYKLFGWLSIMVIPSIVQLFGLIALWLGFASVYMVFSNLSYTESLGLSIASLFQFTGWQRVYFSELMQCLPVWLKILAGSQTIAGIVLLFLLGLGTAQPLSL
jgi:hypothetical protein